MSERALHGVNLTGWLTLEPWVTPSLFAESGALDEATLAVALGTQRYRAAVEEHRKSFIQAADFTRIASRGFNAVRIPVPWYVLGRRGPKRGPYLGCLEQVDCALDWAEEVGLKVVLMLQASPGSDERERAAMGSSTDFHTYRDDLIYVLRALARRYALRNGFFGLEVLSEPVVQRREFLRLTEGVPRHTLRNFYRDAYESIREVAGDDLVIILPDGGMPGAWGVFMAASRYQNVWLDCHLTHDHDNVNVSGPQGVRHLVDASRATLKTARRSGLPAMVGLWSGSLPYADSLMTPEGRIALERVYISEQLNAFADCPAWFFQTWKTEARISGWDARISLATFERRMLD